MTDRKFTLRVWGDFACFTRPEMKVERVSYEVITPSSARAIFDSIMWHPGCYWQIETIVVEKPIKWINFRRNEVKNRASTRIDSIYIEESRSQRATLFLKDVSYILTASLSAKEESKK